MLEIYLDSADIKQIAALVSCLPIKGVTTNPTILSQSGIGVKQLLQELNPIFKNQGRFHVQVISESVTDIIAEAHKIMELPYDMVVKIPATIQGLIAMKQLHSEKIPLLATAIYTVQQGFFCAIAGANYLAPYVNRIDVLGSNGIQVVQDLQQLINQQQLNTVLLPASFKNTRQVLDILQAGVGAITIPVNLMSSMLSHPATFLAVEQFNQDWQGVFSEQLSFES